MFVRVTIVLCTLLILSQSLTVSFMELIELDEISDVMEHEGDEESKENKEKEMEDDDEFASFDLTLDFSSERIHRLSTLAIKRGTSLKVYIEIPSPPPDSDLA